MDKTLFFQDLVERFQTVVQCKSAALYVLNPSNSQLELKAASGYQKQTLVNRNSYQIGEGVTGWIAKEGKSLYANSKKDLRSHPAFIGRQGLNRTLHEPNSFLGIPLKSPDGQVVGVFRAEGKIGETNFFTDADVVIAQSFADLATMAITFRTEKEVLGKFIYAFVLMPFTASFDDIYKYGIKRPITELGITCERVDEIQYTGGILDQVLNSINKASFIIADMTGRNPNVFYEVGYCHAVKKDVILCTQSADDIPFDLRGYNHIVYQGKINLLEDGIRKRALALLQKNSD